ncbi:type II toxin-antitoxin system HicB family antitoxin [Streptobacillus moniliformis]|uniref:type II toxin-antitoxin system HicB family antitoxin n=1 Tax=Streptobacillus moniliformis TaxID=34105 RepID=UPI0007E31127|nr:type II toxin-antitoxin system HicB family antitoxin [Streptobacillus moniliformis]QXW65675.1 type II toxin-antitoxin system HicB family antitoxin [Streptobacillus moniliformis]
MVVYPAIFHKAIEGNYVVVFPDLDNGATEGKTIEEAMKMAEDYIGTWLYDDFVKGKSLPKASDINKILINIPDDEKEFYIEGESFKTLISLDMIRYVNECKSITVRKNVTIPSWLNELGKNHNLNFSNLLQEAIKKELGFDR